MDGDTQNDDFRSEFDCFLERKKGYRKLEGLKVESTKTEEIKGKPS